jgi:diaminopimelate decarboxylase
LWPEGAAGAAAAGRRIGTGPFGFSRSTRREMTLPGAPFLARRGDSLVLDGCKLDALAQQFGTPLYVYSRASMLAQLASYERALAQRPHLVCYAMKANATLAVLQTFARAGCGFDIVSGGELQRVLAAGGDAAKVVFSGVGKTAAEMRLALRAGVKCFNVESEAELGQLSQVAQAEGCQAPVSLRINPDVDAGTHPYISTGLRDNKFGIAHGQALAAYRHAASLPGIAVRGIDVHIGSQITEIAPYLDTVDRVLNLVERIEREGIAIEHLDFGGGLGIAYAPQDAALPTPAALVEQILARVDARGHGHRLLMFEPGRSLVGNAGVLLTRTLYLKPGEHKNFCIVDAAMNDLARPAMYQAWMAVEPCVKRGGESNRWDVVGPVCESGDWLAHDRDLVVEAGDVLAVLSAGAYGMSMASNYNSRPRAAEVMVDDGQFWLIRERESVDELFARERLID